MRVNKKKYDLIKDSDAVTDSFGNFYPDLTTFPINEFPVSSKPITTQLSENDCLRFSDVVKNYYGQYSFYDDIILWLNDIEYISDIENNFDKRILLFSGSDMASWYREFSK